MKFLSKVVLRSFLLLFVGTGVRGQEAPPPSQPVKLADLLAEAEHNNPQIEAARHAWRAAQQTPSQVSTLPDPQFVLQHLSVGSPRPFAGYTNSDFAYVGLGFSQDIPYPGKLRLRGEVAKRAQRSAIPATQGAAVSGRCESAAAGGRALSDPRP